MAIPTAAGTVLAPARKSTGQIHAVAGDWGEGPQKRSGGEDRAEHNAGEGEPFDLLTLHPPCPAEAHHQRGAPRYGDRERHKEAEPAQRGEQRGGALYAEGVGHTHEPEIRERTRVEGKGDETNDGYDLEPNRRSPAVRRQTPVGEEQNFGTAVFWVLGWTISNRPPEPGREFRKQLGDLQQPLVLPAAAQHLQPEGQPPALVRAT
jgi:hypothetical protein